MPLQNDYLATYRNSSILFYFTLGNRKKKKKGSCVLRTDGCNTGAFCFHSKQLRCILFACFYFSSRTHSTMSAPHLGISIWDVVMIRSSMIIVSSVKCEQNSCLFYLTLIITNRLNGNCRGTSSFQFLYFPLDKHIQTDPSKKLNNL